jgi:3-dehydroquinate synthase
VALGGGVIGDLAGFAASVLRRGIRFVQIPTSLLAQVDSSVGGKTGINTRHGKNLIGAFHQPSLVVADTATLATLPPRELRAGLAEAIKYGLLCDADFFEWLEHHLPSLLAGNAEALVHVVRRSCEIKAKIVGKDEREESGVRALLNLGHTFGHAVEAATGYRKWLHGEAVGAGLVMAAAMSRDLGLVSADEMVRVQTLIERAGLPTRSAGVAPDAVLEHMRIDKKALAGRMRLVLLRRIGNAFMTADYAEEALERTLQAYCG